MSTQPASPKAEIGVNCLAARDRAIKLTFSSIEGAPLTGVLVGSGRKGVVLVHQSDGDLCQWLPYGRDLVTAGYHVLLLNLSGSGSSGSVQYNGIQPAGYGLDVAAAVRQLRRAGASSVVLIGASLGGTAVIAGAALTKPGVSGVVSLSAPSDYDNVDAIAAVARLTMPLLVVAAADDADYAANARAFKAAARSSRDVGLLVVPGGAHGVDLVATGRPQPTPVAVESQVRARIDGFLSKVSR